jgi:hypothetical protein
VGATRKERGHCLKTFSVMSQIKIFLYSQPVLQFYVPPVFWRFVKGLSNNNNKQHFSVLGVAHITLLKNKAKISKVQPTNIKERSFISLYICCLTVYVFYVVLTE